MTAPGGHYDGGGGSSDGSDGSDDEEAEKRRKETGQDSAVLVYGGCWIYPSSDEPAKTLAFSHGVCRVPTEERRGRIVVLIDIAEPNPGPLTPTKPDLMFVHPPPLPICDSF